MRIVEYRPHHASLLAGLWNASDAGWPGGLVRLRPKTATEWRSSESRMDTLARFVAFEGGTAVGFVRLLEWWDSPDGTYVQWLNVDPAHHGKGIGKALLLRAMERTIALGYPRIDLHTWPGNDKAMPLYKRTGYMWVPGSHAYLQNYLPLLLTYEPARPFFKTYDWYATLQRDLSRNEDEDTFHGIDAFVYRFQEGRHRLEAVIDRGARGITAFEDDELRVESWIPDGKLVEGLPGKVHWSVRNKTGSSRSVSIAVREAAGVRTENPRSFVLGPRSTRTLDTTVTIQDSYPDTPEEWGSPAIESSATVGDRIIPLKSGFRPKPAIKVAWEGAVARIASPGRADFHVALRNQSGRALRGELQIKAEGLSVTPSATRLRLGKDGRRVLRLRIENASPEARAAHLRFQFASPEVRVVNTLPLPCLPPGASVAYADEDDWVVETPCVRFVSSGMGSSGSLSLPDRTKLVEVSVHPGPPYWPSDTEQQRWEGRTEPRASAILRSLHSRRRPGMRVQQRWRAAGERILELRPALENQGPETWSAGLAVALEPRREHGTVTFPTRHGPSTEAHMEAEWPDWRRDVPLDRLLSEGWIHIGDEKGGYGLVWTSRVREIELTPWSAPVLYVPAVRVPAGGRHEFESMYVIATTAWRDVRDLWAHLVGCPAKTESSATGSVRMDIDPPVALASPSAEVRLTLRNLRRRPAAGTVRLESAGDLAARFDRTTVRNLDFEGVWEGRLRLAARDSGPRSVRLVFDDWKGRWTWELPVVATDGRGAVRIFGPANARRLENGILGMSGSAAHAASLVSLRRDDHEFLLSSYPKPGSFSWFRPFFGGVQPILYEEDWPGNLYKERFRVAEARRGTWRGIRFRTRASKSDLPSGTRVVVDYLTRPGSPLLAAVLEVRNNSRERRSLTAGFWAFLGLDGVGRWSVEFDRLRRREWRHPTGLGWSVADGGFALFHAPRASKSVALCAAEPAKLEVFNVPGHGYHGSAVGELNLGPAETGTVIAMLAIVGRAEAGRYRMLRGLTPASFGATRVR